MSDIFLSYKSEDRAKAQIIAEALEKNGYSVWWDRVIPPGRTFDEVIEEELAAAKCLVVLWSEKSVNSKWIRTEAAEGDRRGILIPVLIEDVTPPFAFRLVEAAKLIDWDGTVPNPEFDLLLESVSRMLGKEPAPEMGIQKPGDQEEDERKKAEVIKAEKERAEEEKQKRLQKEEKDKLKKEKERQKELRRVAIKDAIQENIHTVKRKVSKEMIIAVVLIFSILVVGYWITKDGCFPDVPTNRIKIMEAGASLELIGPLESKYEPIVINFRENNEPIGSIKFSFYPDSGEIFKIGKIVGKNCQKIEKYSNIDRGGDKNVLQNFDTVQMQFGDDKYNLQLVYSDGTIDAKFYRVVIKNGNETINRTHIMEVGASLELIGPLESKYEPIEINFTENNEPIGFIKFSFYPDSGEIFKIEKIVDKNCQKIENYSNIVRGGDKNVLQNFDTVQMQFGDDKYNLRLDYSDGTIDAKLYRAVIENDTDPINRTYIMEEGTTTVQ